MTIFRISFVRISEIEMKTKKGKDMTCEEVLEWLAAHANPEFREGMVRFGIDARLAVGVRVVDLRRLALKIGRNHALALARRLAAKEGAAARRIGRDAVRELTLERIIARIK